MSRIAVQKPFATATGEQKRREGRKSKNLNLNSKTNPSSPFTFAFTSNGLQVIRERLSRRDALTVSCVIAVACTSTLRFIRSGF